MKVSDLIDWYKSLSTTYQVGIMVAAFALGLVLLPNTLVYAAAAFAAYKFLSGRVWKYTATSVLTVITFFSGILWIVGDVEYIPAEVNDNLTVQLVSDDEQEEVEPIEVIEEEAEEITHAPIPVMAPASADTAREQATETEHEVQPVTASIEDEQPATNQVHANVTGNIWYVSSHHSSRFYYHESCQGWQGLSPRYLRSYASEAALKYAFPTHTLHHECRPH